LVQTAINLGYKPVFRNGKLIGIGRRMPATTAVIKQMLDEEAVYKLLSATVHCHSWALCSLSLRDAGEQRIGARMGLPLTVWDIAPPVDYIKKFGLVAAQALARAHWYKCRYFGRDEARLAEIINSTIAKLPQ